MRGTAITDGGLRLDAHKERSTRHAVTQGSIAESLVLPLDQHAGVPAVPTVSVGERVLLGQSIAQPGGEVSAWLHSPVSGTITAIEPRPAPQHGGAPALSIVVGNDGRDDPTAHRTVRFEDLSPADLRE